MGIQKSPTTMHAPCMSRQKTRFYYRGRANRCFISKEVYTIFVVTCCPRFDPGAGVVYIRFGSVYMALRFPRAFRGGQGGRVARALRRPHRSYRRAHVSKLSPVRMGSTVDRQIGEWSHP